MTWWEDGGGKARAPAGRLVFGCVHESVLLSGANVEERRPSVFVSPSPPPITTDVVKGGIEKEAEQHEEAREREQRDSFP